MIEYLKLLVEIVGEIIWPVVVISIFFIFRKDIKSLISRLKSAEIKDFKIELGDEIDDITKAAISHGVTVAYSAEMLANEFNLSSTLPNSYVITETWKDIENLLIKLDDREGFNNITNSVSYLIKNKKIPAYLGSLILNLRKLRNIAAHEKELSISDEEFQNWISISKSVISRLKQV